MKKGDYNEADLAPYHEAVSMGVFDKHGKMLLLEHTKIGKWTPVVGKIDPGDTIDGTLEKELREETTLVLTSRRKVCVVDVWNMRKGKLVHVKAHLHIVRAAGVLKNVEPEKHKSVKWVDKRELLRMDPDTVLVDAYIIGRAMWGGF